MDVDHIEWRKSVRSRDLFPVAVIELTRPDTTVMSPKKYLPAVETRYHKDNPQGTHIRAVANSLSVVYDVDVFAWIIVFEVDEHKQIGDRFWAFNSTLWSGWWMMNQKAYRQWIVDGCPELDYEKV